MVVAPALVSVTETSFGIEYSVHGAFAMQFLNIIEKNLPAVGDRSPYFFFASPSYEPLYSLQNALDDIGST
jgi:hypothetical protein